MSKFFVHAYPHRSLIVLVQLRIQFANFFFFEIKRYQPIHKNRIGVILTTLYWNNVDERLIQVNESISQLNIQSVTEAIS